MNLIIAVDRNHGIGCKGTLLYHIPDDLRYFKEKTSGKVVVMGRGTLESLPNGKPLPNRINVVLSRDTGFMPDGVIVCRSVDELFERLKSYDSNDVFIMGGETVYNLLAEYCDFAFVTEIDAESSADKFFHKVYDGERWGKIEEGEERECNGIRYRFCKYRNLKRSG